MWTAADQRGTEVTLVTIQEHRSHPGKVLHSMADFVLHHDLVIGATNFSILTNRIVKQVLSRATTARPVVTVSSIPT